MVEHLNDSTSGNLPYTSPDPVGAADYYFGNNATFSFILKHGGIAVLRQYWTELGADYFAPVSEIWRRRGLSGVADYWRAFFAAEPGAEVEVLAAKDSVTLDVKTCPAIHHLRKNKREITPCFCQHCYFISEAIASPAGFTVRVEGGNGSCRQTIYRQNAGAPPLDLAAIKEAKC